MLQASLLLFLAVKCFHAKFQIQLDQSRVDRGKETLDQFTRTKKYTHSPCWKKALLTFDSDCKNMGDLDQSFLALKFSNCHLEKSGLTTYECKHVSEFKSCTREMGRDVVAFQAYTEFYTHVSDICFYLQSSLWQERTETTIEKLTRASVDSLDVLTKSIQQQQKVIDSQRESLQNQRDILQNEKLLKDTLLTSAQSTRDVFQEVRDHAQQQKTMFSETFDAIFKSVERLADLQTMLLGEFIGLQSIAFYFVAVVVCYLFTSAPRTCAARLPLFVLLSLLITIERIFVSWAVEDVSKQDLNNEYLHKGIWTLRKVFLLFSIVTLGFAASRYKDFNKINFTMLQELQNQVTALREMQERSALKKSDLLSAEDTIVAEKLDDATKQLEETINTFMCSTPYKLNLEKFVEELKPLHEATLVLEEKVSRAGLQDQTSDSRKRVEDKKPTKEITRKATPRRKKEVVDSPLNDSRYNLRSRGSSGFGSALNSFSLETTVIENNKKTPKTKKTKQGFSSDEEC